MREASDRGFDCLLVGNACGATRSTLHVGAIEMMETEGGIFGATVDTAEEIVKVILS